MRKSGHVGSFARDVHGTSALMFGLMSLVIFGMAGVAIDAARGFSVRSSLQAALDAAMLAAAQDMHDSTANLSETARRYIESNFREKLGVDSFTVSVSMNSATRQLNGAARVNVPVTLARVLGLDGLPVNVESQIVAGTRNIEAMLVLDNTGSMQGAKLDELKSASRALITNVFSSRNADRYARIGIVPFAQYVNVGMANRNAPWLFVADDYSINHPNCGMVSPVISRSNCRMVPYTYTLDGVTYSSQYEECDYVYGAPEHQCNPWTQHVVWNGCVGSRAYPLDTLDQSYANRVPGIMDVLCPSAITPLTNDDRLLHRQIDDMTALTWEPYGATYIPGGLTWGWRALSKSAPYEEAHAYGEIVNGSPIRKMLVLMTDGANTLKLRAPYDGTHVDDGRDPSAANALTAELCTNIKAQGIEIVTIAFGVSDNAIKSILRACATEPGKFYDAISAGDLNVAFRDIARDMVALHIAK